MTACRCLLIAVVVQAWRDAKRGHGDALRWLHETGVELLNDLDLDGSRLERSLVELTAAANEAA